MQEMLRGIGSGSSSDNQSSSAPPILGGGGSNSFGGRSNTNDARSRDRERR